MELNRKYFRAIIFYNFRREVTQQQCIDELNSIFGYEVPLRTSVYWWYGEFNQGCRSLQDKFREGRPFRGASKHIYNIFTGDESWIYAYEPENKQQSIVRVFQDEPNPTKVTRARSKWLPVFSEKQDMS